MPIKNMNHVVIKDQAVTEAKAIVLPRGFALESVVCDKSFYAQRDRLRSRLKRKRGDGSRSYHKAIREHGGYLPPEIFPHGAVALSTCRLSTLDKKIHPLLTRSRFDDTLDYVYN